MQTFIEELLWQEKYQSNQGDKVRMESRIKISDDELALQNKHLAQFVHKTNGNSFDRFT